jgi:hypothetical protein
MTRMFSLVTLALGAALLLAVPAWSQTPHDAFERAVAAESAATSSPSRYADAFERAAAAGQGDVQTAGFPADAFERTALTSSDSIESPTLADHNSRMDAADLSAPASISTTDREVEWPQIGIGFGLGVLLALGLVLGMRVARIRPLAH